MEVLEAIKDRRSIRKYKTNPVPDNDLTEVLEAARWAPSWANTQCWKFIVVKNPDLKRNLAGTLPPGNPALSSFTEAPVVIVACAQLAQAGYFKGKAVTDKDDWCMFDVALAMQNLTLAAHSKGLGTVHVGFFDAKAVSQILEVPEGFVVVEMTPLGYPDGEAKATSRKELSEFVSYEKFGVR
ncbi:MAG: nitroreductase family protein [Deltaproteobacteria bacterium]|nr:nitroreductase family protein [Deltaproteobacteria bacterium]